MFITERGHFLWIYRTFFLSPLPLNSPCKKTIMNMKAVTDTFKFVFLITNKQIAQEKLPNCFKAVAFTDLSMSSSVIKCSYASLACLIFPWTSNRCAICSCTEKKTKIQITLTIVVSNCVTAKHFISRVYFGYWLLLWVMVFNATFNNISAISWWSVLLVEETLVPGENYRPVASHLQTSSHNVVSSTPRQWTGFELSTLVVIGTDCTGNYKSNYYMITTMMAPLYY